MPLRLDFTSGPSQQQDEPVPPTSERTDDPPQPSVALLDDDDDVPEDPRTAVGLMLDDAFDLMDNMFPNRRQDIRVCIARTGGESIAYAELSGNQVMRKRGINATVALYKLITGLRNNEQARQASSEQSTNGISAMFREMFPDYTMYEILVGEWFSTGDGMVGLRRFTALIRARRENGDRALSLSFRGDTYPNALQSLWRGISDVYHTWSDFPDEEGEAARLSFMQQ